MVRIRTVESIRSSLLDECRIRCQHYGIITIIYLFDGGMCQILCEWHMPSAPIPMLHIECSRGHLSEDICNACWVKCLLCGPAWEGPRFNQWASAELLYKMMTFALPRFFTFTTDSVLNRQSSCNTNWAKLERNPKHLLNVAAPQWCLEKF